MVRLRASDLAAIFEIYMLAVALGALKTALDTRSPWYDETITQWVLGATFVGGVVLLGAILAGMMLLLPPVEPARVRPVPPAPAPTSSGRPAAGVEGREVDELLLSLEQIAGPGQQTVVRAGERATVAETPAEAVRAELTSYRRSAMRRTLRALLGPAITCTVFSAISAALLPGAAGFLQSSFTVNTFLILTFSYGWGGLIAYTLASLYLAAWEA